MRSSSLAALRHPLEPKPRRVYMLATDWMHCLGRVSFINCEPIFHDLDEKWTVLGAPPSWLTGHLLRKDCILAPIPAADYANHCDELVLLPELGISSAGEVGSVLVFGDMPLKKMKTLALPSDSATSVALLKWLLKQEGLKPQTTVMGPDFELMLEQCDGALLIGDRALEAARDHPEMVQIDLGKYWLENTGLPMVFGVFAARKDTPREQLRTAHKALVDNLDIFETNPSRRSSVIATSAEQSGQSAERLERYFGEVFNRLDQSQVDGLTHFLATALEEPVQAEFAW